MTDINSGYCSRSADEQQLREAMELLYFAYRDFIKEPDQILEDFGFGRAHHRAIHFVGRNPGITVSELLGILRITKQSLSRVLGQLIREGFVYQAPGPRDRRQRLLHLTPKGAALERRLSESQRARIAAAYRHAGASAVEGFRAILLQMISPEDREAFLARIASLNRTTDGAPADQTESEPSM